MASNSSIYEKGELLTSICRTGNLAAVVDCVEENTIQKSDLRQCEFRPFFLACCSGNVDLAMWLVEQFNLSKKDIFDYKTEPNQEKTNSEKTNSEKKNKELLPNICWAGHLEMAKWLTDEFYDDDCDDWLDAACAGFRYACRNGHLEVAKWLHKRFQITSDQATADKNLAHRMALNQEHLHVLSWLLLTF